MSEPAFTPVGPAERGQPAERERRPITIFDVFGELLITAGVLVLLFVGWQVWWQDMFMASEQSKSASQISQKWITASRAPRPSPTAGATPPVPAGFGAPAVRAAPATAQPFAVLYIPRYGPTYHRTVAEGIGFDVLNSTRLGVGHYPQTQMPGAVGNFAVAAHRSAYGGGMHLINELQLGDAIYVQTADGYYTYRFRDLEYVPPSAVEVLAPVPRKPGVTPTDRLITLTTCNPLYSTAERIIAYGVFESWQPISVGPPAEIAPVIAAQGEG